MTEATQFRCSTCDALYKVVKVEAAPEYSRQLICLSCGAPLRNRDGKSVLKYFRVSDEREITRNGRKSKL